MAEVLQMDLVEVLNFLFQLGSLELGEVIITKKGERGSEILLPQIIELFR
jgi:hypothetical protein